MATLTYADTEAYEAWSGSVAPTNISVLLRSASTVVRDATRNDLYDVDTAGKPADPDIAAAFADATCEHALYWQANQIDPAVGAAGIPKVTIESTIDGATIKYDTTATQVVGADLLDSLTTLCPAALSILRAAGLASAAVCG